MKIFGTDIFGNETVSGSLTVTGSLNANNITGSLLGTSSWARSASWAPGGSSTSASYASTASYLNQYSPYSTITTGSNQYITASFSVLDQVVNITIGQAYNFTCSNMPTAGNTANTTLYINNTATATSSLSFPASWKFLGSAPSSITSSKVAVLSLKSYDASTVIASFAVQY